MIGLPVRGMVPPRPSGAPPPDAAAGPPLPGRGPSGTMRMTVYFSTTLSLIRSIINGIRRY